MHSQESIYAASLSASSGQKSHEHARARLALMGELHASLSGSCKALLTLDLAGITRGTEEQVGLSLQLADMAQENRWIVEDNAGIKEELKQSQHRVLQALRLQSAILGRARSKLRVLANSMAGPSVNYSPPPARSRARLQLHTSERKRSGEI